MDLKLTVRNPSTEVTEQGKYCKKSTKSVLHDERLRSTDLVDLDDEPQ